MERKNGAENLPSTKSGRISRASSPESLGCASYGPLLPELSGEEALAFPRFVDGWFSAPFFRSIVIKSRRFYQRKGYTDNLLIGCDFLAFAVVPLHLLDPSVHKTGRIPRFGM